MSTAFTIQVYPLRPAQLDLLFANKSPAKVLPKYLDYADVFLFDLAIELSKHTNMNKYTIELVERK